ncbi:hypothetical protein NEMIN01_0448 [Nematocida minor]|uniref:uncharacterized protein n=1 Tax=Nematocida minor TaxID=1912983 RepID=UPI00222053DA|nr:uncharacterized protein NEMIN01_0448 [Nematocida minor]KAI5189385.1 hypothetical protein NEMIN01_0448 [Nematocida minor]
MKAQKLLSIGSVFAFFVARCRGSWNGLGTKTDGSSDLCTCGNRVEDEADNINCLPDDLCIDNTSYRREYEYFNPTTAVAEQIEPPKEYVAESRIDESNFSYAYSTLSKPTDQNIAADKMDSVEFSSTELPKEQKCEMKRCIKCNGMYANISKEVGNSAGTSTSGEERKTSEIHSLDSFSTKSPLDSSFWDMYDPFGRFDTMIDLHSRFEQYIENGSMDETAPNEAENSASPSTSGKKRKISETNNEAEAHTLQPLPKSKRQNEKDLLEAISSILEEDKEQPAKEDKKAPPTPKKEEKTKKKKMEMSDLNIGLWNKKRLNNLRRKGYKSKHKKVCDTKNLDMSAGKKGGSYYNKLIKEITDFSANIAGLVEHNALWYFIASRTSSTSTKYTDLWQLKEWLDEKDDIDNTAYADMVESFRGYYPGAIEDMIAYVEKNQPLRTSRENPLTVWKETLGDIFTRECLELNYYVLEEQFKIGEVSKKYHEIIHAVHMIMALPEVYQDFSRITVKLIKETKTDSKVFKNMQNQEILLGIHKLVQMHMEENIEDNMYKDFYTIFKRIYVKEDLKKLTAIDLYREMYMVLGSFYERVPVIDVNNEYVLVGKCIITNQKYVECKIDVVHGPNGSLIKNCNAGYTQKENKWNISSDIHSHYHVYYVDNAKNKYRRLCMPFYKDARGEEHCMHTIDGLVDHIKMLYRIHEESDVVHPFKVDKESKRWSYIREDQRDQTVKDLPEYEVMIYRIKKEVEAAEFTFARFLPLNYFNRDSICIPLFLTEMMRSAVQLGPFKEEKEHKKLDSIKLENEEPSVYVYNKDYVSSQYSDVHHYYGNLYIPTNAEEEQDISCYVLDCQIIENKEDSAPTKLVWHVRMPESVDEFTHCVMDDSFKKKENSNKFSSFVKTVKSRKYCQDSRLQGLWLSNSHAPDKKTVEKESMVYIWNTYTEDEQMINKKPKEINLEAKWIEDRLKEIEDKLAGLGRTNPSHLKEICDKKKRLFATKSRLKRKLENLDKELHTALSRGANSQAKFMVFRNMNSSKSNLGAHNEVLDVLISIYRNQKGSSSNK